MDTITHAASSAGSNPSTNSTSTSWHREREIDLAIRGIETEPLPFTVDGSLSADDPHDVLVEAGQIRLLSGLVGELPYLAVLDRWMDDIWLVAPFSPYSSPATAAEVETGIDRGRLRVIQSWNARTAHGEILGHGYVAGCLDEGVRQAALDLFRRSMRGELPETDDPEVAAYLEEYTERWDPLTREAEALEARLASQEAADSAEAPEEDYSAFGEILRHRASSRKAKAATYDSRDAWGSCCSGCRWAGEAHKPCVACKGP